MREIKEVSGLEVVFGGRTSELLPLYKDIPAEFRDFNQKTVWNKVVTHWFFRGLKNAVWTPKAGVDQKKALAHVAAIMGSFEPKHEHKEAGCAYLLSEWFDGVTYDDQK